ncbi:MAG: DUF4230 domain-containing protein [Cyanobacteria bacterium J06648_16]
MAVRDQQQINQSRVRSQRAPRRPSAPEDYPTRRSSPLSLIRGLMGAMTGGALLVGLLAGYAFWRSGPRFLEGLKLMVSPPPPEDTVDLRTVVVQQVRDASELTTAVFTMETVVPAESDRTFAGYTIGKTNLLYVAHGDVRAGIDLSEVQPEDVIIRTDAAGATTLQVQLPAPRLLDSKIDVSQSQVYDYDRGFLNLGPDRAPQLQTLAQQAALVQIEQAACEEGILQMASDRATLVVKQLLGSAGYENVNVETLPATACRETLEPRPAPLSSEQNSAPTSPPRVED